MLRCNELNKSTKKCKNNKKNCCKRRHFYTTTERRRRRSYNTPEFCIGHDNCNSPTETKRVRRVCKAGVGNLRSSSWQQPPGARLRPLIYSLACDMWFCTWINEHRPTSLPTRWQVPPRGLVNSSAAGFCVLTAAAILSLRLNYTWQLWKQKCTRNENEYWEYCTTKINNNKKRVQKLRQQHALATPTNKHVSCKCSF